MFASQFLLHLTEQFYGTTYFKWKQRQVSACNSDTYHSPKGWRDQATVNGNEAAAD